MVSTKKPKKSGHLEPSAPAVFPLLDLPREIIVKIVGQLYSTDGLLHLAESSTALHSLLCEQVPQMALVALKALEGRVCQLDTSFLSDLLHRLTILQPPDELVKMVITEHDPLSLRDCLEDSDEMDELLVRHGLIWNASSIAEALALLHPPMITFLQTCMHDDSPPKNEDLDSKFTRHLDSLMRDWETSDQIELMVELSKTAAAADDDTADDAAMVERGLAVATYSQWGVCNRAAEPCFEWKWAHGSGELCQRAYRNGYCNSALQYEPICDLCDYDMGPLVDAIGVATKTRSLKSSTCLIQAIIRRWVPAQQLVCFARLAEVDARLTPNVLLPLFDIQHRSVDAFADVVLSLTEVKDWGHPKVFVSLTDTRLVANWIKKNFPAAKSLKLKRAIVTKIRGSITPADIHGPGCHDYFRCMCPEANRLIEGRKGAILLCLSSLDNGEDDVHEDTEQSFLSIAAGMVMNSLSG